MGKSKMGSRDSQAYTVGDVTYGAKESTPYNARHKAFEQGSTGSRPGKHFLNQVKTRKEMVP